MTGKVKDRRQQVVIVGGGVTGSLLARELSSKLNQKEYELVLIEPRLYAVWLIAGARLVTEEGCHPGLEERALVPYGKLFHDGNGSVKRGRVVSIHSYSRRSCTNTRGGDPDCGRVDTSDAHAESEKWAEESEYSGHVVLEDGENVPYDALILATGSKHSGPIDFPDEPAQCRAHLEHWRTAFREATNIVLVGGGGVAIGPCSIPSLLVVFQLNSISELAGELKDYYPVGSTFHSTMRGKLINV